MKRLEPLAYGLNSHLDHAPPGRKKIFQKDQQEMVKSQVRAFILNFTKYNLFHTTKNEEMSIKKQGNFYILHHRSYPC